MSSVVCSAGTTDITVIFPNSSFALYQTSAFDITFNRDDVNKYFNPIGYDSNHNPVYRISPTGNTKYVYNATDGNISISKPQSAFANKGSWTWTIHSNGTDTLIAS